MSSDFNGMIFQAINVILTDVTNFSVYLFLISSVSEHGFHNPSWWPLLAPTLNSFAPFPSITLEWHNCRPGYTIPSASWALYLIQLCWLGCALNLRQQTLSNSPALHNLSTFLQPIVYSLLQEGTFTLFFFFGHQHRASDSTSSFIEQKDRKTKENKTKHKEWPHPSQHHMSWCSCIFCSLHCLPFHQSGPGTCVHSCIVTIFSLMHWLPCPSCTPNLLLQSSLSHSINSPFSLSQQHINKLC